MNFFFFLGKKPRLPASKTNTEIGLSLRNQPSKESSSFRGLINSNDQTLWPHHTVTEVNFFRDLSGSLKPGDLSPSLECPKPKFSKTRNALHCKQKLEILSSAENSYPRPLSDPLKGISVKSHCKWAMCATEISLNIGTNMGALTQFDLVVLDQKYRKILAAIDSGRTKEVLNMLDIVLPQLQEFVDNVKKISAEKQSSLKPNFKPRFLPTLIIPESAAATKLEKNRKPYLSALLTKSALLETEVFFTVQNGGELFVPQNSFVIESEEISFPPRQPKAQRHFAENASSSGSEYDSMSCDSDSFTSESDSF